MEYELSGYYSHIQSDMVYENQEKAQTLTDHNWYLIFQYPTLVEIISNMLW